MLQGLLQGKGDLDGLAVALAALFAHHYTRALDKLLAFVGEHKAYVLPLFLVALARHQSVRTYAAQTTGNKPKVTAFARALRDETEKLLRNEVTLDTFNATARDLWMVS